MERFGPFLLVHPLGKGGMGEVFLARSPWPAHPIVAVKRLHAAGAATEHFMERFEHEAQLAVRLRHPQIVSALHVGSVASRPYVVSELVLGQDVEKLAIKLGEARRGAPIGVALWILNEVLPALAYVHGAMDEDGHPLHLIHRDITPRNILFDYDGYAKLADFGLAKSRLTTDKQLTNVQTLLGTPNYMAPESLRHEVQPGQSMDIYGLGASLYTMLTGLPPFWGDGAEIFVKIATETPLPLATLRPDLPDWFTKAIESMMGRIPSERPTAEGLHNTMMKRASDERLLVPRFVIRNWLRATFSEAYHKQQTQISEAKETKLPAESDEGIVIAAYGKRNALKSVVLQPAEPFEVPGRAPDPAFDEADTFRAESMTIGNVVVSNDVLTGLMKDPSSVAASVTRSLRTPKNDSSAPDEAQAPKDEDLIEHSNTVPLLGLEDELQNKPSAEASHRAEAPPRDPATQDNKTVKPAQASTPPASYRAGLIGLLSGLTIVTIIAALILTNMAQSPSPAIPTENLQTRYFRIQATLQALDAAGDNVPEEAWAELSKVAEALQKKDVATAARTLEVLEESFPQKDAKPPPAP